MRHFLAVLAALALWPAGATVYHVAASQAACADTNPGTADQPWKTLAKAASAPLLPGDTVLVHEGVYREEVVLTRSGEPGRPVTLAAAPGERVAIKGSDVVRGPWTRVKGDPNLKEPYPNAYANVWRVALGDEFFAGPHYTDKARRYVSQVFRDGTPLQQIGPDPIYRSDEYDKITVVGRDLRDIHLNAYYYDNADQSLYVCLAGEPAWYLMEVATRQWLLTANRLHDVVIRGLSLAQNRQPGGQWPAVSVGECERVTLEDCTIEQADFCGLGLGRSRDCVVRRCNLVRNGNTGLGMGECTDCQIVDCTLSYNNTRRFHDGWHCGGAKCIPSNRRCTIARCEAAFNVNAPGIWFDYDNAECRILDNVVHDNGGAGIFYEINKGGGTIAGNLVYANASRGIYLSGSQNVWVVGNTVAGNNCGIVAMPREGDWTLENNRILGNLLLGNTLTGPTGPRGCEITIYMGPDDAGPRTVTSNHSDYNVFASGPGRPTFRQSWNPDNLLDVWQQRYGEDLHSRSLPLVFSTDAGHFRLAPSEDLARLAASFPRPDGVPGWTAGAARVGCGRAVWPAARPAGTDAG